MRNNLVERRNEAKIIRRIVSIMALLIILAVGSVTFFSYKYIHTALQPVDPNSDEQIELDIPIGSSTSAIGNLLEENGIIHNATVFKYFVKFNNYAGFQAGNYTMSPAMTLDEISQTLQTGRLVREALFKITIPEGLNLNQIAGILSNYVELSEDEIMEKFDDQSTIELMMAKHPDLLTEQILDEEIKHPLEGYLFPATYSFYEENPSLESIIDIMLEQTSRVINKYIEDIHEKDLSIHEVLTLGSLIEKEATQQEDRHLISGVFYNRLEVDMPLQTDPTLSYALGEHLERTLYKDTEVDSPYNTYIHTGLTPGPIANSGESSIEAALNPSETDYLYFLAEYGTGKVHYSKTLEEHNQLREKYIIEKREADNGENQ